MRCDILLDARSPCIGFDNLPEALSGHWSAVAVDKQRLLLRNGNHVLPHPFHIFMQRCLRLCADGNDTAFCFAAAMDIFQGQIQIRNLQRNQLSHANAGRIKQLQHGFIAHLLILFPSRLLQKQLHLFQRKNLRGFFLHLRQLYIRRRVFRHHALLLQKLVKRTNGRNISGNRCPCLFLLLQLIDIRHHIRAIHLCGIRNSRLLHKAAEPL